MDEEYIEREALLKTPPFTKCASDLSEYSEGYLDCVQDACEAVRNIPAADVAPVVHGEWVIPVTKEPWIEGLVGMCTNCGYTNSHTKRAPKFCEECGAKMDGGKSNGTV